MHVPEYEEQTQQESEPAEEEHIFSLDLLPPEEQELHRRAYRVAKVSMQDIKMLRPEDVRVGRENKDLCFRLRDDIEKAHKEYDRRFQSIQSHPVDYFYDWMVEILADGDAQALGKYPYDAIPFALTDAERWKIEEWICMNPPEPDYPEYEYDDR